MDRSLHLPSVGDQLRQWRQRRRLSQLELAGEAGLSTRHLSFLETGRSMPSREMLLRLAERLAVPLRERNALMLAAGFAPMYRQRPLDDAAMRAARTAVDALLAGHEPYPALAVDRHWNLVATNAATRRLLVQVDPALLAPPVNVMRVALHPRGLAPQIVNLAQWRAHLLERVGAQFAATADPVLAALFEEMRGYTAGRDDGPGHEDAEGVGASAVAVPLRLRTPAGTLSLIGTITVFGTPTDVTLSEIALESFFPADTGTAERLRALAVG